jgi:hypothetical protein
VPGPHRRRLSRAVLGGVIAAAVVVAGLIGYGVAALARSGGGQNPNASSLDSCLFGTWTMTSADVQTGSEIVVFTGQGPSTTFQASGIQTDNYGSGSVPTLEAQVDGVTYTLAYSGSATGRYTTKNGKLLMRALSAHGEFTYLRNGSPVSTTPITSSSQPGSAPYTCSASTLRMSLPHGVTEFFTKDTHS